MCTEIDLGVHDPAARLAALDREELDIAILSLQPTLGLVAVASRGAGGAERDLGGPRRSSWSASANGRFAALARREGPPRASSAPRSASARSATSMRSPRCSTGSAGVGGFLFVHPSGSAAHAGAPAWWPAIVDYTHQMQAAYLDVAVRRAGALADGERRLRDPRRRRAVPARAARLAGSPCAPACTPNVCSRHRLVRPPCDSSSASRPSVSTSSYTGATSRSSTRRPRFGRLRVSANLSGQLIMADNRRDSCHDLATWLALERVPPDQDLDRPALVKLATASAASEGLWRSFVRHDSEERTTTSSTATRTSTSG